MSDNIQKACIWAGTYKSNQNRNSDITIVKERIMENGVERSNMKLIKNFKRPYYITKPGVPVCKEKRDWEYTKNLIRYESTDAGLARDAGRNLGMKVPAKGYFSLKDAAEATNIYGLDITGPVLIKSAYIKKFPDFNPMAHVAVIDYETDMVNGNGEDIICGAYTQQGYIKLAVARGFIDGIPDIENTIRREFDHYFKIFLDTMEDKMKENLPKSKIKGAITTAKNFKKLMAEKLKLDIDITDDSYTCAKSLMDTAHKLGPDYLCAWNAKADIQFMLNACRLHGKQPETLFCHPDIPKEYRTAYFHKDTTEIRKEDGTTQPKDIKAIWDRMIAPAPFTIVDSMRWFWLNRKMSGANLNSYALDAILNHELGLGKFDFDQGSHLSGAAKHRFMQTHHKIPYIIYCVFDALLTELLDMHTYDVSLTMGAYLEASEFADITKNPKRLSNDTYEMLKESGRIQRSTPSELLNAADKRNQSASGWVITLPAERVAPNGISIVEGIPNELSRIYLHCGDNDVASGYPNGSACLNISFDSVRMEIYGIEGLSTYHQRCVSVNMTAPEVNAVELSNLIYQTPRFKNILDYYD